MLSFTKMASSSSGSSSLPGTNNTWDPRIGWDSSLASLGIIGEAIKEVFAPRDVVDFSFMFEDEESLREFHEQSFPTLEAFGRHFQGPVREGESLDDFEKFREYKDNSEQALLSSWKYARQCQSRGIALRAADVRSEVATKGALASSHMPPLPTSKQTPSRPGAYFGLGSIAKGHQVGLSDWKKASDRKIMTTESKDKIRFVHGVWADLGNQGLQWDETDSITDASNRSHLFLHRMEEYKDNLGPKISAYKRWTEWCWEQSPSIDHKQPTVVQLGSFLLYKTTHGATAAANMRAQLLWWRDKVGVPLPINHPSLTSFKNTRQGHEVNDGVAPQPWHMLALHRLALQKRGMVSTYAAIFVITSGACLRWRHVQRSRVFEVRKNAIVFRCSLGKSRIKGARHPFLSPAPREWIEGQDLSDLVLPFWKKLEEVAGTAYKDKPFLIPNVTATKVDGITLHITPESTIIASEMKCDKGTLIFRALLVEAGVQEEEAARITLKSLRKFMPTAGATFELQPHQLNAIGDWQDTPGNVAGQKGRSTALMPQTYSDVKIDVAYKAKKWLVAGLTTIAETRVPDRRYALSEFLEDEGTYVDIKWFTWDYAMSLSFATHDNYEALVKAVGASANIGKAAREEELSSSPAGAKKRRRESSVQLSLEPPASSSASPEKPLAEGLAPLADATSDAERVLSGAESSEDDVETPQEAAAQIHWFCQTRSTKAHFYKALNSVGHPIPYCHANRNSDLTGSEQKGRNKEPGFPQPPEMIHEGFIVLNMMSKTTCRNCLQKLPESMRSYFPS